MREQEQERQWKQLQASRAREQQMQQIQHSDSHEKLQGKVTQTNYIHKLTCLNHYLIVENTTTGQLQISTNSNDGMSAPMASPSPNSRMAPFSPVQAKNQRINIVTNQPNLPNQTFHHPMQRPVSVQIPRQVPLQQRVTQSPFSPQSQTPQSPHDQFPLSPATSNHEPFSRPASECSQPDPYLNVSRNKNHNTASKNFLEINCFILLFPQIFYTVTTNTTFI